jgi:hypothetical protein
VKFAAIVASFLIGLVTGISFDPSTAPLEQAAMNINLPSQFPDVCARRCIRK